MTGKAPEQEPSIEEILASIRQIISDDDEAPAPVEIEQPKEEKFEIPVHQPEPVAAEPPRNSFADVLELTNEIPQEEKVIKYTEEPKYEIPVHQPEPEKDFDVDFQEHKSEPADEALFSKPVANATQDAFSRLIGNVPVERPRPASSGVTLEDITRDLLRPMLRQWIDENVPRLVERLVEKELEKLSRKVRDD
jgi:cell pole-organizing protein PopZ